MKSFGVLFLVLISLSYVSATVTFVRTTKASLKEHVVQAYKNKEATVPGKPSIDMCSFCFDFMNEAVDELEQAIVNGGVIGGCADVCSLLINPILIGACTLVCDYVGIDVFIDAINVTDPDPIYICQDIDLCPVVNGGAVTVNGASVDPPSGPQGTTFTFELDYTVTAPTGPGLQVVNVFPPDAEPFGNADFSEGQPVGKYSLQVSLQASPSEQEPFDAGEYIVEMGICEGDCSTVHPYGGVYAAANVTFKITQ